MWALIDLSDKGEPADLVTLTAALQSKGDLEAVGGSAYLATLVDYVPTAANIAYYCRMVKDKAVSRRLIQVATEIATRGYDGGDVEADLDWAEKSIFEIAGSKAKPSYFSTREIMKDTFKTIEKLYDRKELITGVPTGFNDLDLMTAGLQGGQDRLLSQHCRARRLARRETGAQHRLFPGDGQGAAGAAFVVFRFPGRR